MKSGMTLRFARRYAMAHRLISGVAPRCGVPHGHDEVVTVDIVQSETTGLDPDTNMIAEFSSVKGRWFSWIDNNVDHSFHLSDADPLVVYFREHEPDLLPRLLITPGDPTVEIRAACYLSKLNAFLIDENAGLRCSQVSIRETPTNEVLCPGTMEGILPEGDRWWKRADSSINDLI